MSIAEKLTTIAENEQKVYDAGKQAEYDRTWDAIQQNGNRDNYTFGFAGYLWNKNVFFPKYDITVVYGNSMFYYSEFAGSLKERLEQQGVTLTFPNATNIGNLFYNATKITELGVLDFSTVQHGKPSTVFYSMPKLHTIEKLILPPTITSYSSWFNNCSALENLIIEGVITNNISFSACTKLTHESLKSILNALMYVRHTYTKTSTVVELVRFDDPMSFAPDWPAYTTTGEKVFYGYNEDYTWDGYCCLADGVYYAVTEAENTNTYTLTLGATNLAKLTEDEIAEHTAKGWTLV